MTVIQVILPIFKAKGWVNANSLSCMVGAKSFASAVGPKEATAYCSGCHDGYNYRISGLYESEGRNILQARSVLIPVNSTKNQITQLAVKFLDDAEREINESFAVRLLRA